MKILITGASGFVARYLIPELERAGHELILTSISHKEIILSNQNRSVHQCDLSNPEATNELIRQCLPEAVVHLAAISEPNKSQVDSAQYIEANAFTTANLAKALSKVDKPCMLLYVSSGLIYETTDSGNRTITEADVPAPKSPYSFSKFSGEAAARAFQSEKLKVIVVRPFNHIGPFQRTSFVCSAFADRIAKAKDGDVIRVGNLNSFRDFTDVRDIVRAYRLILEKNPQESLFVLGSGKPTKIEDVLMKFIELSGKKLRIEVDPALIAKHDSPYLLSNPTLAAKVLGWTPQISLDQSLSDIYKSAI